MISPKIGELTDIRWADVEDAVNAAKRHRDLILGIKARLARPTAGDTTWRRSNAPWRRRRPSAGL